MPKEEWWELLEGDWGQVMDLMARNIDMKQLHTDFAGKYTGANLTQEMAHMVRYRRGKDMLQLLTRGYLARLDLGMDHHPGFKTLQRLCTEGYNVLYEEVQDTVQ